MNQAAAIRRASQQARNAMEQLDAQSLQQLQQLYADAAEQVRAQIRAAADAGDQIPQYRLQALLAQIDSTVDQLGQQRDTLLRQQITDAAALGTRPFTAGGAIAVGGSQAAIDTTAAMAINQSAVEFVLGMRQADGINLSERVWNLTQGAKETLNRAIASAIIRGTSATRAASDLAFKGQPVPGATADLVNAGRGDQVAQLADLLSSGDGGELWKAQRVFRTEINRAHGEAYMGGAIATPGFAGFRMLLSPAHPRFDICDLLCGQNLYGLGKGVYPTRELTPWPAHPNTLTFLVMVFANEITGEDAAGKETELQALQRLGPDIREGALGQTKAQYFDRGLLTKGMIRARLGSVEERLQRQGKI